MKLNHNSISRIAAHCAASEKVLVSKLIPKDLHLNVQQKRKASVLIPLCNRHGVPSLLFTVRTKTVGTHKGQVSFPGGHVNDGETWEDAALRETYEELGETVGDITTLGTLQTIPAITGTLVTPILAFLEKDVEDFQHLVPSEGEVDRIFTRSLAELLDPNSKEYETLSRGGQSMTMPSFGPRDSDERIWGLTAMILDAVLSNVVAPCRADIDI